MAESYAPTPPGPESGEATGESGTPPPAAEQPEGTGGGTEAKTLRQKLDELAPADRKAYLSFEYAQSKAGKKLEDREAYRLLKNEGISEKGDAGELTDYKLPAYETWARQIRRARHALEEQKYQKRSKRPHGKSIVKGDEIEYQLGDDE